MFFYACRQFNVKNQRKKKQNLILVQSLSLLLCFRCLTILTESQCINFKLFHIEHEKSDTTIRETNNEHKTTMRNMSFWSKFICLNITNTSLLIFISFILLVALQQITRFFSFCILNSTAHQEKIVLLEMKTWRSTTPTQSQMRSHFYTFQSGVCSIKKGI